MGGNNPFIFNQDVGGFLIRTPFISKSLFIPDAQKHFI